MSINCLFTFTLEQEPQVSNSSVKIKSRLCNLEETSNNKTKVR